MTGKKAFVGCKSPFFVKDAQVLVGCGRCLFCRIKKRNKWTARLILENACHSSSIFVTLTYSDDFLPSPPSVSKRELQLFLKRLRKALGDKKIRYYACGEYGDEKMRPHYHLIIFGMSKTPEEVKLIDKIWNKGLIDVRLAEKNSFRYVAGYVSKKYSKTKDELIKDGTLEKEFSLMSRRPALGTGMLQSLVESAFLQHPFDVLMVIRSGGRSFPLDKTMRDKLRAMVMTSEEEEHIKELTKGTMQDALTELIYEELGSFQLSLFRDKEKFAGDIAKEAYFQRYEEELRIKEHYLKTQIYRKDT